MRSRPLVLLASTALLAAPVAVLASPAQAAECTSPQVLLTETHPNPVVIGTTATKNLDVFADIQTNGCTVKGVDAKVVSPTGGSGTFSLEQYDSDATTSYYGNRLLIDPQQDLYNADAGTWKATVTTTWDGPAITTSTPVKVLRASRLSTNAAPEPVRKGATITITGALTRANWETGKYTGYTSRTVQLQFRTPGGSYAGVKTVTSGSGGALKTTVTAAKDGCFRYVFPGSSTTAKVTSVGDCVDVT
ncbi:MAG: FIG01125793: hypothetical protein [uncultured Friedmanniella sp.]|uniref:Uncharacterized protein n=1 Tax=uncultured Friedmanniella sp. TaxID=335381 RepID=A0A6J4LLL0_9ACTN|nr:hypothetical protein [uncultured Friedmanniella sp.]CAA9335440.1 MAG: FIG01125793: hypothetical protein [uncultured Friedmanniella sp.]